MYFVDIMTDIKPVVINVIWVFLIIYLIVIVMYVLCSFFVEKSIVKSFSKNNVDKFNEADLIYYLPIATLQVTATAKVLIKRQIKLPKVSSELIDLTMQATTQNVPDTSNPYALKYQGSSFSSDTFKVSVNSLGLIEGINVTAEDRITSIINSISDSPKTIFSKDNLVQTAPPENGFTTEEDGFTTEVKEVSKIFYISSDELKIGKADCLWRIHIEDVNYCDASFYLKFDQPTINIGENVNSQSNEIKGIFTRPLSRTMMCVFFEKDKRDSSNEEVFKNELIIPDYSKVTGIVIDRSSFIKKTYALKVSNGILIENSIDKPSEVESFISMPIAVAKAIVSIPAQLIQLRVVKIKNETTLETTEQALRTAKLATIKNEISLETEIIKAKFEAHKGLLEAEKNLINEQKALATARKAFEDEIKKLKES
ncbi:hypothetical protein [Sabulibacter ruber]|uniref:hypothetical protein n=1 Tax=Sabulibacter ruber TaxID=2811901 RepID=UPI001A95D693|nr:hypothetical protein [Sabulibacter ruber]